MQQRKGKYSIYSKYIIYYYIYYIRAKEIFLRFLCKGERKEKLRQKKRESPQRENSLQAIIFVASRKRSKPFAFLSLIHHSLVFVEIDDFEHHD